MGTALGFSLYPLAFAVGIVIPNESVFYGLLGYLMGAFVAALLPTSRAGGIHRASLVPRRLSDYLPRWALAAPGFAVAVSGGALAVYEVEPHQRTVTVSGSAALVVLVAVASVATLAVARIVVARSQPATSPELVVLDDALRAQAMHTLVGAGLALALLGTTFSLLDMGSVARPEWLRIFGIVAACGALVATVVAWGLRTAPWTVQRHVSS
jgi:hypothetical protein